MSNDIQTFSANGNRVEIDPVHNGRGSTLGCALCEVYDHIANPEEAAEMIAKALNFYNEHHKDEDDE